MADAVSEVSVPLAPPRGGVPMNSHGENYE